MIAGANGVNVVEGNYDGSVISASNAAYIAAASPSVVLGLLDRLATLERDHTDLLACHARDHEQLAAVKAALAEACEIADALANYIANNNPYAQKLERIDRITELKKAGQQP
jgi:hypothetical protein